jgi:energy-coupling factor transport system substrate-specific component
MKIEAREIILFGVLGGLLSASQIALSFIPNIEIITFLIILFSMIYRKKALYIAWVFVMIMGFVYGFGLWWLGYLILWPLLSIFTCSIMEFINGKYLTLAIYSGIFGFLFGFFYAIPYAIFGGLNAGIVYWIAGIQFDIIHGIGNYFIMLLLGEKVFDLLNKLNSRYF